MTNPSMAALLLQRQGADYARYGGYQMDRLTKTAFNAALLSRLSSYAGDVSRNAKAGLRELAQDAAEIGRQAKQTAQATGDALYDLGTFVPKSERWSNPSASTPKQLASPLNALWHNFWDPRIPGLDRVVRTELTGPTKWNFSPLRAWGSAWKRLGQDVIDTVKERDWKSWDKRLRQIGLGGMPGRKALAAGLDVGGHIAGRTIRHTPFLASHAGAYEVGSTAYDTVMNQIPEAAAENLLEEHEKAFKDSRSRQFKDPQAKALAYKMIPGESLYPDRDADGNVLLYGPNSPLTKVKQRLRSNWLSSVGLGLEGVQEALYRRMGYPVSQDTTTALAGDMALQTAKERWRNLHRAQHEMPLLNKNYKPNLPGISRYPRMLTAQGLLLNALTDRLGQPLTPEERTKGKELFKKIHGKDPEQSELGQIQALLQDNERKELVDRRIGELAGDKNKQLEALGGLASRGYFSKLVGAPEVLPYVSSAIYNRMPPESKEQSENAIAAAARFGGSNPEASKALLSFVPSLTSYLDKTKAEAKAQAGNAVSYLDKTKAEARNALLLSALGLGAVGVTNSGLGSYLGMGGPKAQAPWSSLFSKSPAGQAPATQAPTTQASPVPPKTETANPRTLSEEVLRYGLPIGAAGAGLYGLKALIDHLSAVAKENKHKKKRKKRSTDAE